MSVPTQEEDPERDPPRGEEEVDDPRDVWTADVKSRLVEMMAERDLSHRDLAKLCGLSAAAISVRLSKGDLAQWWALFRIAQELQTTPDVLLGVTPVPAARGEPKRKRLARLARLHARSEQQLRQLGAAIDALKKE